MTDNVFGYNVCDMIEIDEDTERVLIFQWPRFSIRTLFYQDSVIRYLSYFQFSNILGF